MIGEIELLKDWSRKNATRLQRLYVKTGTDEILKKATEKGPEQVARLLKRQERNPFFFTIKAWTTGHKLIKDEYGVPTHKTRKISVEQALELEDFSDSQHERLSRLSAQSPELTIRQHRYDFVHHG